MSRDGERARRTATPGHAIVLIIIEHRGIHLIHMMLPTTLLPKRPLDIFYWAEFYCILPTVVLQHCRVTCKLRGA